MPVENNSELSKAKYIKFARPGRGTFDRLIGSLFFLSCILLGIGMLVINFEIGYRSITHSSQLWAMEVSEYILLLSVLLGTAWVLKKDQHIKIDLLSARLPPRPQTILNIVTYAIVALLCLAFAWYSSVVAWKNFQMGAAFYKEMAPPIAPFILVVALGFFLLFIQYIRWIRIYVTALKTRG